MARPDNPSRVYLDSSAFIKEIKNEPGHEPITRVLELAQSGKIILVTSMILVVEARGIRRGEQVSLDQEQQILTHLDDPRIEFVELGRAVAFRARKIALQEGLRNYDAIHLACAVEGAADVLMTCDEDFPVGRSVEGVWIDQPYAPGGPDLFNPEE